MLLKMLSAVSVLAIFTVASAIDYEASNTITTYFNVTDWNNTGWSIAAVVDPRITEINRFLHVICTPTQTKNKKICRVTAELFSPLGDNRIICRTNVHLSEQGKIDPWPYIVPLNNKIIFPWIDSGNGSCTLTIRSIDIDTCKANDVSIRLGVTPLYTIVPFKNSFDVLYAHSDDGLNFSTLKASYDQYGKPIDEPISIFAHIPADAMQDEYGFSYPFPHQMLPVSDEYPGRGYFFVPFNSAFQEILILRPDGTIKKRAIYKFHDLPNLAFTSNERLILTAQERGNNEFRALQVNDELDVINDVAYKEEPGRKFIRFFVLESGHFVALSADEAESSRAFYLEKIEAESNRGKPITIGRIDAENYEHVKFYFSYMGDQICVRALFSEDFRPKKLYTLCIKSAFLD